MKLTKKLIAMMLCVILMFSVNITGDAGDETVKADTTFAITSPTAGSLVAAGYIDIDWTDASSQGAVKNYRLYVDGSLVTTTTNLTYEFYTTKVNYHTAWVVAEFTDGTTKNTASVRFGVSKKGLGLATDMGANLNLKDMGVAWYYNWGENPSSGQQYQGIEYVPMIWKSTSASNIKSRVNALKAKNYKYVLTFNEPDLSGQCDMTVDAVYSAWQGLDDVTGIRISSPVTAIWPQSSTNWFQAFMNKLDVDNDHDVDFISIHCYPDNYGGAGMAEWFVEEVVDWTWNTYKKPIWITEFSTTGEYITATGNNGTKEFWEAVMPELDKRDYVERYAAFGFNNAKTGLWLYSTGTLTPAGEVYKALGNPTTDYVAGTATNTVGGGISSNVSTGNNSGTDTNISTTSVKKPAKAKIKSVKNKKGRKIKISIKKIKKATGYQIRYSNNKKFKGYWSKTTKKTSYTIRKLKKKTRYYIKVRAYVKNGSKKVYGAWSKVKKIKVKK